MNMIWNIYSCCKLSGRIGHMRTLRQRKLDCTVGFSIKILTQKAKRENIKQRKTARKENLKRGRDACLLDARNAPMLLPESLREGERRQNRTAQPKGTNSKGTSSSFIIIRLCRSGLKHRPLKITRRNSKWLIKYFYIIYIVKLKLVIIAKAKEKCMAFYTHLNFLFFF